LTQPSRSSDNPAHRWLVTMAAMCGSFMVVLDATVVNVALPKIMLSYGVGVNKIQWVITSYLLTMAIMMPSVGWLSRRMGHKLVFIISFSSFTLASAFCGLAWSANALVAFRVLQGIGAGLLMPIAMVVIFEAFPSEEKGMAMGIYGMGATLGPAVGPTLGGYLIEKFSWHLIFLINVPVGLLGIILATLVLPKGVTRKEKHFDVMGFLTMTVALGSFLMGLSQGQQEGWTSGYILSIFAVAVLSFAIFLVVEFRSPNPFIDLQVYKSFLYSMTTMLFIIQGIGLFGATFLIPLFFETMLGYSALKTGILLVPMAVAVTLVLPIAGRLADRMDARIPVIIGVVFSVLSLYWLSFLNLHTSSAEAVGMLVMRGLGLGFIFPPIMNLALKSLPEDKVATGSSLINVSRQVGGALGVALLGAMLDRRQLHHETVLAQTQTVAANSAACLPQQMQTWLSQMSGIDDPAHLNALTTVQEFLKQKALVASFDDCFMISASIFALAFIPAILMRKRHA